MSENVEYNPNDKTEDGQSQDRLYDSTGRPVAGRDVDPNEANELPDEVLVDNPVKVAHEDLAVRSMAEAEAEETRGGGDFENAPSARELRDKALEDRDGEER